ncbi:metallo-beta-lactamase family protein [Leptolyngbya sp. Heron Island J]|uniref:MBL fold metallo-hydrolase n=1 Tax=Leptolyngbya sp. Heron Island J TaxID=1385935 RepID=UPI0003B94285|nr:MBL fold metallo-hydrolase [Leptolyngbya sp. Heron Island J]ESA36574.1 metallo-beta-lactamase family protein [Leptolyngbya sp. Heron Island J]
MNELTTKPFSWFLLGAKDATAFRNCVSKNPTADLYYRHAMSCQYHCYEDGTLSQARLIDTALRKASSSQLTNNVVEMLFTSIQERVPLFDLNIHNQLWEIEYIGKFSYGMPVNDYSSSLFIKAGNKWIEYELQTNIALDILLVFSNLANGVSEHELLQIVRSHTDIHAILNDLVEERLIYPKTKKHKPLIFPYLRHLGHACLEISDGNTSVIFDPLESVSQPSVGTELNLLLQYTDAVFLSHAHWDHVHYQTLARLDRSKPLFVPKCSKPSPTNPPISKFLRSMGFSNIHECLPGSRYEIGKIEIFLHPFYGEPFGLDSYFDAFTFEVRCAGYRIFASVDACFDERGSMIPVLEQIAKEGTLDILFFGCTGQKHDPIWAAASPRRFSFELHGRPELVRYHANSHDIVSWCEILEPRIAIPYAGFSFDNPQERKTLFSTVEHQARISFHTWLKQLSISHPKWHVALEPLQSTNINLGVLRPLESILLQ